MKPTERQQRWGGRTWRARWPRDRYHIAPTSISLRSIRLTRPRGRPARSQPTTDPVPLTSEGRAERQTRGRCTGSAACRYALAQRKSGAEGLVADWNRAPVAVSCPPDKCRARRGAACQAAREPQITEWIGRFSRRAVGGRARAVEGRRLSRSTV